MTALKASSLGRTFGLLAFTAHGLPLAEAGSYSSWEGAGWALSLLPVVARKRQMARGETFWEHERGQNT